MRALLEREPGHTVPGLRPARVPNLFMIGVPKAGTTSLARWLTDHPEISGGVTKELRFLMDRDEPLARRNGYHNTGLHGYERLFRRARPSARYLLDASPEYYYQTTAKQVIAQLPDAQVIIVLRNPALRALSMFRYGQNNMAVLPPWLSFRDFLGEARKGHASRLIGRRPMLRDAIRHGEYARYVREWRDAVGQARLHTVIFEELAARPWEVVAALARALDVDPSFYADYPFPRENDTYAVRSRALHRAVKAGRRVVPGQAVRGVLKRVYARLNTAALAELDADDQRVLADLKHYYQRWNLELGDLLQRDLSLWR